MVCQALGHDFRVDALTSTDSVNEAYDLGQSDIGEDVYARYERSVPHCVQKHFKDAGPDPAGASPSSIQSGLSRDNAGSVGRERSTCHPVPEANRISRRRRHTDRDFPTLPQPRGKVRLPRRRFGSGTPLSTR